MFGFLLGDIVIELKLSNLILLPYEFCQAQIFETRSKSPYWYLKSKE